MQVEACELVLELINYDDKDELLRGLVQLLSPSSDEVERARANATQDDDELVVQTAGRLLSVYVQQASQA